MEFNTLIDLIQVITPNKLKSLEILKGTGKSESRTEQFYRLIASGKLKNDEQAANYFFNTTDVRDQNYRKLKNKLFRQLINTNYLIDLQSTRYSDRLKALYYCNADFAAANILLARRSYRIAIYLLQQVLEQAIKFEFLHLAASITRTLRFHFARSNQDRIMTEKYKELNKIYENKRYWSDKAQDYIDEIANYFNQKTTFNQQILDSSLQYYQELLPKLEEVNTSVLFYRTYWLGAVYYSLLNDYEKVLELVNQCLDKIQHLPSTSRGTLSGLAIQKIDCLIHLRRLDYPEFKSAFDLGIVNTELDHLNYYRLNELTVRYYLFTKQYDKALETFKEVSAQGFYQKMTGQPKEVWILYSGYLHLLGMLKQLDAEKVKEVLGEFRMGRFMGDITIFDKEKDGMNIPLMLLPILVRLAQNDPESVLQMADALEKYRKRHLDEDTNKRSAIFVRFLVNLAKVRYETTAATKKIARERHLLSQYPPQKVNQAYYLEVIPYEDLWQMLDPSTTEDPITRE